MDTAQGTRLVAYADDLAAVVTGENKRKLMENGNRVMEDVDVWMKGHGLELAPDKTEAVILTGMRRATDVQFKLREGEVGPKKEVNYLGITIERGMVFGPHVNKVAEKAERTAAALSRLMPNIGGPQTKEKESYGWSGGVDCALRGGNMGIGDENRKTQE
ncbi:hypothetical protein NQ317_019096 [Molorchus minor]|uniref:Reverse transcriptase domain-containing protein n=1 Tax=Molorchus minor TaxID=1323400 RepID=A0ABQ9JKV3_9CUCU|nr:hypothetical protein NQ317_019096 [Molorchus minor]